MNPEYVAWEPRSAGHYGACSVKSTNYTSECSHLVCHPCFLHSAWLHTPLTQSQAAAVSQLLTMYLTAPPLRWSRRVHSTADGRGRMEKPRYAERAQGAHPPECPEEVLQQRGLVTHNGRYDIYCLRAISYCVPEPEGANSCGFDRCAPTTHLLHLQKSSLLWLLKKSFHVHIFIDYKSRKIKEHPQRAWCFFFIY